MQKTLTAILLGTILAGCGKEAPPTVELVEPEPIGYFVNHDNQPRKESTVVIAVGDDNYIIGWDLTGDGDIDAGMESHGISYGRLSAITITRDLLQRQSLDQFEHFSVPGLDPTKRWVRPRDDFTETELIGDRATMLNSAYKLTKN